MRLRGSGEQEGRDYDLSVITADTGDGGVEAGDVLRGLTEAAIRSEWDLLDGLRADAFVSMGKQETVDALTVAAAFNGITRVADSTGIPLDDAMAEATASIRAASGIDQFSYAEKSARYDL